MIELHSQFIELDNPEIIFGPFDRNIHIIEDKLNVHIMSKDNGALIEGDSDKVNLSLSVIKHLKTFASRNENISENTVLYILNMVIEGSEDELDNYDINCICITSKGRPIKAKTIGQKKYCEAIKKNTVVLSVGPAGTGKTFLAVAMAVKALKSKDVSRIILTRPAVEAGERLGFLPGDLQSKIDPYLRPLYDSLYEMLGYETCSKLIEKMTIEIAPLAYMRGRTLDDSFIILDEAQNTTPEQMKMFLTRLGNSSKIVVTGDLTQTDLPHGVRSGLIDAVKVLDGIDDIAIHHFSDKDVVRHKLVQKIILAYENKNKKEK